MARFTLSGASKAERLAARASHLRAYPGARLVPGPAGGAAYIYERREKALAVFFMGSSAKPLHHIAYATAERRAEAVAQFHADLLSRAQRKATAVADRRAAGHAFKVGDIVNTSWGYDQTNVDFYAVTRTSAKCVWVRPIAADYEQTGFMSGRTWPAMPIRYTGEESRHVPRDKYLTIKGHSASITTGDRYSSSYA